MEGLPRGSETGKGLHGELGVEAERRVLEIWGMYDGWPAERALCEGGGERPGG